MTSTSAVARKQTLFEALETFQSYSNYDLYRVYYMRAAFVRK